MGSYNPHAPQILGQEWVPIREDPLTLTPVVNLVEVGHRFTAPTSRVLQTARFYLKEYPPGDPAGQVMLMALYQQGKEDLTGPIQSVIIPCSLGTASGGTVTINDASTIAEALANPSDSAYVIVDTGQQPTITLRFETESYMPLLMGKRILGIDFLYANLISADIPNAVFAGITSTASTTLDIGTMFSTTDVLSSFINTQLGRLKIGEIDWHWNAPITNIIEVLPWTPNRLRCFDNSSGLTDRSVVMVVDTAPTASQSIIFDYAAIEVFFCEEQRIAYGGKRFVGGRGTYILGMNQLTVRDLTDAINPTLAPGDYSLVLSSANLTPGNAAPYPEINQIQQLYDIPTHVPVRVVRPYPIDPTAVGKTFTTESTVLLPQLSLHTSGGPLTEVHAYGRQAVAQVYGSITATQEIMDSVAGASYQYPWVRYYARRFGDTTVDLLLDSPSIPGSSVSLTPDDFDALDEIIDGWKEVTLRFDTPPSMGTGTQPQWRWSATGETAGSRWEVLGAYAPALSGAPGNLLNRVPSPHQLSSATYGMPVSGASINLGWIPQYAPPVSATSDDQTADATLIFSQDPPTITGMSVVEQDFTVTGIGLDCGVDPCCIPSEIQYHRITWPIPEAFPTQLDLPGVSGSVASTPDTAALDITGDIDLRAEIQVDDWLLGSDQIILSKYDTTGDQRAYEIYLQGSTNFLRITWSTTGANTISAASTVKPEPDENGRLAVRVTLDVNDGSGNRVITFYTAPSMAGPWTQLGATVTGTSTSIFSSSARLEVGSNSAGTANLLTGTIFKAQVRNGIDGTIAANPDFTAQSPGTTSFTDSAGLVWTVSGTAQITLQSSTPDFSSYELQRMDTVDTDWQTIMMATSLSTTGFNDYEARVGILSSYRIRVVNVYDFPGSWSDTVTSTLSSPGVTIGCDEGHLLIFTSNEEQDGSLNLAYSSVWENNVEENFTFPESRFVELQAMYNRDFFTAFRPMERGGEQFSRTVLVQAAAISPETLANFVDLRDMAWANVSYICVRDEDGNRWFSTVLVPSGRVLRDRRLYLAPVEIIEVTDTPSQVDP